MADPVPAPRRPFGGPTIAGLAKLTITKKFVGLSIVLLSIMLAAAVYAFVHSAQVDREAAVVTGVLAPLSREIDSIEQATDDEELLTERVLRDGGPDASNVRDARRHQAQLARFETLSGEVDRRLTALGQHIRAYEQTPIPTAIGVNLGRLQIEGENLRRDHEAYRQAVRAILDPAPAGGADAQMARDQAVDDAEQRVLAALERMSDEAAKLAASDEQHLERLEQRGYLASVENLALAGAAFLAGGVLSLLLTRRMLTPVRRLIAGTEAVGRGDLDVTIPVTTRDEIGQLSSAFSAMVGELRHKASMKETFSNYIDPRVVDRLLGEGRAELEAGEKREMTVFFSDLQGFSSISETLTPTALVKLINHYLAYAGEPIQRHQGVIDKYIGDAVMAYWGPPFTHEDPALSACLAALAQGQQIARLQEELPEILGLRRGAPKIAARIGLATGDVVVGSIGSQASKNFTILGDTVNIASRLEGANKAYGTLILTDEATARLAERRIETREIDLLAAVGKTEAVRIFELLGEVGAVDPAVLAARDAFQPALAAYRARDWDAAEAGFAEALRIAPQDGPSRVFLARVAAFRAAAPPADWGGVWRSTEK